MRKILSLLICWMALSLSAATIIEVDGLYYNLLSDSASVEVTYPTSGHYQMTTLSIPSSVSYNNKAYTVTAIGFRAFEGSPLTSVTIPNTVTTIGRKAFYNSQNPTTINIPNSVFENGGNQPPRIH